MKRFNHLFLIIMMVSIVLGTALPTRPTLADTLPVITVLNQPPYVAAPCYGGTRPPIADPICMVFAVEDLPGNRQAGVRMTIGFGTTSVELTTGPVMGFPADMPAVAYDVRRLGANLSDVITVDLQQGGPQQTFLVAAVPDAITRTQIVPPFVLGKPVELSYPPIWGTVDDMVTNEHNLAGIEVELWITPVNGKSTLVTTATTQSSSEHPKPFFGFTPSSDLPVGTRFEVRAYRDAQVKVVPFSWDRQQIFIPVVFGTSCIGAAPRGGGAWELPGFYCLKVLVQKNGVAVDGAMVNVTIVNTPQQGTTKMVAGEKAPVAMFNIGPEMFNNEKNTKVFVSVLYNNMVGIYETTLKQLWAMSEWEQLISVSLQNQLIDSEGLAGGVPVVIAGTGPRLYATSTWGGLSIQEDANTGWRALPGNNDGMLPSPEITAIAPWSSGDNDRIVLGMRDGSVVYTVDSGVTWTRITPNALSGPIEALAIDPDGMVYGAQGGELFTVTFSPTVAINRLSNFGRPVTTLAASDRRLYIGHAGGLVQTNLLGTDATKIYTGTVQTVGVASDIWMDTILVGTPGGVVSLSPRSRLAPLNQSVTSLALVDRPGQTWVAATPNGIYLYTPVDNTWRRITHSETAEWSAEQSTGLTPWLGTPVVYSFAISGSQSLIGTNMGTAVSNNEGRVWKHNQHLTEAIRAVAFRGADYLALGQQQLVRWNDQGHSVIAGLPAPLNGTALAVGNDGTIAVGAGAGPNSGIYILHSLDATWQVLPAGARRGVNAIVWLPQPQGILYGFVATDNGAIFGLTGTSGSVGTVTYALTPVAGSPGRLRTLAIDNTGACRLVAGSFEATAHIFTRPCDLTSAWVQEPDLQGPNGTVPSLVTDIDIAPNGRFYVATSEGLLTGSAAALQPLEGAPLRPLAVGVAAGHPVSGQVMFGGAEGMLIFNDISPDLTIDITSSGTARGGETVPITVTVSNIGLLPVIASQLSVDLPDSLTLVGSTAGLPMKFDLDPAASRTFTLTVNVSANVAPSIVLVRAEARTVSGERSVANNVRVHRLELDYRAAPDSTVGFAGDFEVAPLKPAVFYLLPRNIGSLPDSGGLLRVTIPAEIAIGQPNPAPASRNGATFEWNLDSLPPGGELIIAMPYSLTTIISPNSVLINAEVIPSIGKDDRHPANNTQTVGVRQTLDAPETLMVIARSRLTALPTQLTVAFSDFNKLAATIELALDTTGPCDPTNYDAKNVACLYDTWDDAVARVAQDETAQTTLALLKAQDALTTRIQDLIEPILSQYPSIKYIVFVGDDRVIPGFAVRRETNTALSESLYASVIDKRDVLYGVAINNAYISDMPYEALPKSSNPERMVISGRLIGTPLEMARTLQNYVDTEGRIEGLKASISGYAVGLTLDTQETLCDQFKNLLPEGCDSIADTPLASQLRTNAQIIGWSGHGDSWSVNRLTSEALHNAVISQANIIMLLACHVGLVPTRTAPDHLPMMNVLAGKGNTAFAFTAYAMAIRTDPNNIAKNAIAYAEEEYMLLGDALLTQDPKYPASVGAAFWRARRQYIGTRTRTSNNSMTALDWKTVESLRLYGLPNLKVFSGKPPVVPAIVEAAVPSANETLTIDVAWNAEQTDDGTLFLATVAGAKTVWLAADGHTLQQAVEIVLPNGVGDVKRMHGNYHDVEGIDPVIPVIAALSDSLPYSEPPYTGGPHDWTNDIWIYTDSSGRRIARIPLGEWHQNRQTQRLYDKIILKVKPNKRAETNGTVLFTSCLNTDGSTTVSATSSQTLARAEVMVADGGSLEQIGMREHAGIWTARINPSVTGVYGVEGDTLETNATVVSVDTLSGPATDACR